MINNVSCCWSAAPPKALREEDVPRIRCQGREPQPLDRPRRTSWLRPGRFFGRRLSNADIQGQRERFGRGVMSWSVDDHKFEASATAVPIEVAPRPGSPPSSGPRVAVAWPRLHHSGAQRDHLLHAAMQSTKGRVQEEDAAQLRTLADSTFALGHFAKARPSCALAEFVERCHAK